MWEEEQPLQEVVELLHLIGLQLLVAAKELLPAARRAADDERLNQVLQAVDLDRGEGLREEQGGMCEALISTAREEG